MWLENGVLDANEEGCIHYSKIGAGVGSPIYIGQIYDASSNLNYLNARYQDPSRGQFLSEDPTFLAIGNQQRLQSLTQTDQTSVLSDPQTLNSYSYGRDNPISKSDPSGLWYQEFLTGQQSWASFNGEINNATVYLPQVNPAWGTALDHPYRTGAVVGLFSAPVADAALTSTVAITSLRAGVGTYFLAGRLVQSAGYAFLAGSSALGIPSAINTVGSINNQNPSAAYSSAGNFAMNVAPTLAGGRVSGVSDVISLLTQEVHLLTQLVNTLQSSSNKSTNNKKN